MVDLLVGFAITLISLLVGFTLGKHQTIAPPDIRQKINDIFTRVVPNAEVGAVNRPSAQEIYYRDHPDARIENEEMEKTFDKII